ncbi:MAG: hypothetical protein LBJ61_00465 [Deltaproteobacteria bacterium]|jgi:hypothetical protein|nr:hypothetical protein [Deltaproteobacteria bacterium]
MKNNPKPQVVVIPGFKLILLFVLTLILLQFVTGPTKEAAIQDPANYSEITCDRGKNGQDNSAETEAIN